jgi:hypothetical protein
MSTEQLALFDGCSRQADIERLIGRLLPSLTKEVCQAALKLACAVEEFTAEDVRAWVKVPRGMENSFSSAMLEARRLKIIKVIRYRNASRREAKGRALPVYTRGFGE